VFGRGKSEQDKAAAAAAASATLKEGGKGRPTPSRKEAEQRNRRPIVGGQAISPTASKAERKAARQAQREVANRERAVQRQALVTGDEKHLPARDRGPARRYVRDYVDARRSVGEYFLPVAVVVLGLSLAPSPLLKLVSVVALYGMVLVVAVDAFLLRRKLKRETEARFGDKAAGAATYGMMRTLQLRRTRLPRPQVQRGQYPQ
jgi:hypothetical protein